jgi:hypothetical protein
MELNPANLTIAGHDGAEPTARLLSGTVAYGAQCSSILQCGSLNDCCFGLATASGFGRCYPSCSTQYSSVCGKAQACAVGLICSNGHCINDKLYHPTTVVSNVNHVTTSVHNPQQQLAILTKNLKTSYHAN